MYSIILVLVWLNQSIFDEYASENDFYIFVPSDLDLWPVDLKFAPPVTYPCPGSSLHWTGSFLSRENRMHGTDGQKDGVRRLVRSSMSRVLTD